MIKTRDINSFLVFALLTSKTILLEPGRIMQDLRKWRFFVDYEGEGNDIADLIYEETCVCDTPLCNVMDHPFDFQCHGGDFALSSLSNNPSLLNQTHSCYTNREQCYIMKYKGEQR